MSDFKIQEDKAPLSDAHVHESCMLRLEKLLRTYKYANRLKQNSEEFFFFTTVLHPQQRMAQSVRTKQRNKKFCF